MQHNFFFNAENTVCYYDKEKDYVYVSDITNRFIKIVGNLCIDDNGFLYRLYFHNHVNEVILFHTVQHLDMYITDILCFGKNFFVIDEYDNLYYVLWSRIINIWNLKNVKCIKYIHHCYYSTYLYCDNKLHIISFVNKTFDNVSDVKFFKSYIELKSNGKLYRAKYITSSCYDNNNTLIVPILSFLICSFLAEPIESGCVFILIIILSLVSYYIFVYTFEIIYLIYYYKKGTKVMYNQKSKILYDSSDHVEPENMTVMLRDGSLLYTGSCFTMLNSIKSAMF